MLGGLARADQRAKGELYLRGLMLDGKRKSMQPMAKRLGVDHQQLQQFVTSSTWDYVDVRHRIASWRDGLVGNEAVRVVGVGQQAGHSRLSASASASNKPNWITSAPGCASSADASTVAVSGSASAAGSVRWAAAAVRVRATTRAPARSGPCSARVSSSSSARAMSVSLTSFSLRPRAWRQVKSANGAVTIAWWVQGAVTQPPGVRTKTRDRS
ncbi:transposase [Amycolatopsis sp. NPDC051061]|uniref:transposase n=1 Tax=Amycolatopsis sp. NPDC051061 TaxID=3155042 RepID=UPI003431B8C0